MWSENDHRYLRSLWQVVVNMSVKFYLGVALAIAGIVLMSLPDKPCADCDDEVTVSTPIYSDDSETLGD